MKNIFYRGLVLLLSISFFSSCYSKKQIMTAETWLAQDDKPIYFEAVNGSDKYILGLYKDSTYILGKNRAERISIGRVSFSEEGIKLKSYVQSFEEQQMKVKASYRPNQAGYVLKISSLSNPYFIGGWMARPILSLRVNDSLLIDSLERAYLKDLTVAEELQFELNESLELIEIQAIAGLGYLTYEVENPKANYFEIYGLFMKAVDFIYLNQFVTVVSADELQLPLSVLETEEVAAVDLSFKRVKNPVGNSSISATEAEAILSAYQIFTAAGRRTLLEEE